MSLLNYFYSFWSSPLPENWSVDPKTGIVISTDAPGCPPLEPLNRPSQQLNIIRKPTINNRPKRGRSCQKWRQPQHETVPKPNPHVMKFSKSFFKHH